MLERVSDDQGTWEKLMRQWEAECDSFGENLDDYATASLPVVAQVARGTQVKNLGAYAFTMDGSFKAVCQANATYLPGYTGKVLRIRHIVLAPEFDFSPDISVDDYITVLVGVFSGAISLTNKEMEADHLKFHLRSPAEREFGTHFTKAIHDQGIVKDASVKGSWIYLSKI